MGRQQRTVIDGQTSSWLPVWSGEPQGSILGQLLFVIYINDLPDVVDVNTTVQLYADDSKYYRLISESVEQDQLQNAIIELVFIYSAEFGRRPAGEGANLDRRLVPYTRDARRIKSRIELSNCSAHPVWFTFTH